MSKIEWTDATWNPVVGCTKVSPGCQHCYAEKMGARLAAMACSTKRKNPPSESALAYTKAIKMWFDPKTEKSFWRDWSGKTVCIESALEIPLHWRKSRMIFVCSMGDLPLAPYEFFVKVMTVIKQCPQHTFQILTKRPEMLLQHCTSLYEHGSPPDNLWLGATVCNQPEADKKIPILLQIPAAVRFVSIELMLGAMDIRQYLKAWGDPFKEDRVTTNAPLNWVILGGESGPGARPCKLEWVRSVVNQCRTASVPVFVKQLRMTGCRKCGFDPCTHLHGHRPKEFLIKDINQFPEDLRIRQYPKGGE